MKQRERGASTGVGFGLASILFLFYNSCNDFFESCSHRDVGEYFPRVPTSYEGSFSWKEMRLLENKTLVFLLVVEERGGLYVQKEQRT
jgi:hypothetical protein